MNRVERYNREAERCARLAQGEDGPLRETYMALEASYRILAASILTELWWPRQLSPPPTEEEPLRQTG